MALIISRGATRFGLRAYFPLALTMRSHGTKSRDRDQSEALAHRCRLPKHAHVS